MTTLVVLVGALGGLGLLFLVLAYLPRRRARSEEEPILLAEEPEQGRRSLPASLRRILKWLEGELRGKPALWCRTPAWWDAAWRATRWPR